jgi:hypothetical protein
MLRLGYGRIRIRITGSLGRRKEQCHEIFKLFVVPPVMMSDAAAV